MKRSTPLKRTPMRPAKPKAQAEPKKRKCKICRELFVPRSMTHKACGPDCAQALAEIARKAQKARETRQERAQDKIKRESMKTYPQLIREAQKAFNSFVRLRDQLAGHPCISSGRPLDWSGNAVDAGHFRSTGSAPHLRFNEDNCHAQSKHDNQYLAGNAVDYRINLVARIGLDRVEALEADNTPRKWSHDELRGIKEHYQRLVRERKKSAQATCAGEI